MKQLQKNTLMSLALISGISLCTAGFLFGGDILSKINFQTDHLKADLLQTTQTQEAETKSHLLNYLPRKLNSEIHKAIQTAIFPADFDRNNLLTILESISLQHKVDIDSVLFGDEIDQTYFRLLPLAMEITAPRAQLMDFLSDITQKRQTSHRPLFNVTDMIMTAPDLPEITLLTQGANAKWNLSLQIETFAQSK